MLVAESIGDMQSTENVLAQWQQKEDGVLNIPQSVINFGRR